MRRSSLLSASLLLRALLLAGALLQAAWAHAQPLVQDFAAGPPSGSYRLVSFTTPSLEALLDHPASGEPVNLLGQLFLPPGEQRVPAVLLMHGSGGVYSALLQHWPALLNQAGVAAFVLDRFGPRGVRSTATDQSQVPLAADVEDAFQALRLLASHPRIDPARVAIMGFSRGGTAAWRTAVQKIVDAQQLPGGLRFAAHVMVYSGGCAGAVRLVVRPGVFTPQPQLWLHGEADNYAAIGPCQAYAQQIGAAGTPVEFVALPGAHHKFDADSQQLRHIRQAERSVAGCPLAQDIDSRAHVDQHSGARLRGAALTQARADCRALGADVQGNLAARAQADQALLGFLARTLKPR
jgi:dienelactone hydrolase